jgi:hypothetical protein
MAKFSLDQWIGIILIIAAVLIWAPIPIIGSLATSLGALAVVVIGIYEIFFR